MRQRGSGMSGLVHQLDVRLVESDHNIARNLRHKLRECLASDGRARRVIGITDENQACAAGDSGSHCRKIIATLRIQRHRHRSSPGDASENGVGLEAAPREHDLIPIRTGGLYELQAQSRGAAADRDLLHGQTQVLAELNAQVNRAHVRVAVRAGGWVSDGL